MMKRALILMLLGLLSLVGCAGPESTVRLRGDIGKVKEVAVLPLDNLTSERYAAGNVQMLLISELLAEGFDVIETGEVRRVLQKLGVRSVDTISNEKARDIAKLLDVDALITGAVGSYGMVRSSGVSYPEVTLQLIFIDGSTGKVIWSAWATEGGPDASTRYLGAQGKTVNQTARELIRGLLKRLHEGKEKQ